MNEVIVERPGFTGRLAKLLQRTQYCVVTEPDKLEEIYRLRYDANLREGTIGVRQDRKLHDRFDELPNVFNIAVSIDGALTAALRMHVLSQAHPESPVLDAYPDLIAPQLNAGKRLIDTSRLAASFEHARAFHICHM